MCGIAGLAPAPLTDQSSLENLASTLKHRGPDDRGSLLSKDARFALVHTRLSIIDLSPLGHQPMLDPERKTSIVFNGEVYNFQEIRAKLKSHGIRFNSNSDTEVILKAYGQWREQSFDMLEGMFAFALLDEANNKLYLVRDSSGIKPLYYSIRNDILYFGSEIKAFKSFDPDWPEAQNWREYFLIFGHLPEPHTTLEQVYMLPKGNFLSFDLDTRTHELTTYSNISFSEQQISMSQAIFELKNLLEQAVSRHLISDAPIGVFLSGGIDSSILTLLANRSAESQLRTISVNFEETAFDEAGYQDLVLKKVSSRHHSYVVRESDFLDHFDKIFAAMDQPTIDGINTYFVAKCAHDDGLKVALSGLGGDELFGGYPSFERINSLRFLSRINSATGGWLELTKFMQPNRLARLSYLNIPGLLGLYLCLRGILDLKSVASLTGRKVSEIRSLLTNFHLPAAWEKLDNGNLASCLETNLYMTNQLLRDSDFMSMCHSLEMRVPFLDKNLLKFVMSLPQSFKFGRGLQKILLIEAFKDELPPAIYQRAKRGFSFPMPIWLKRRKFELLERSKIKLSDLPRNLCKMINNDTLPWYHLWALIVLKRFGRSSI